MGLAASIARLLFADSWPCREPHLSGESQGSHQKRRRERAGAIFLRRSHFCNSFVSIDVALFVRSQVSSLFDRSRSVLTFFNCLMQHGFVAPHRRLRSARSPRSLLFNLICLCSENDGVQEALPARHELHTVSVQRLRPPPARKQRV